jgi:hypothetical protein
MPVLAFLILLGLNLSVQAQSEPAAAPAPDTTVVTTEETPAEEAPAEETPSLISPALSFVMVQRGDSSVDLRSSLTARVNGQAMYLYRMKIRYFLVQGDTETELGFAVTNTNGKALLNVRGDSLKTDAEGNLVVKAVFAGNKLMESAEETIQFKRALLTINPVKEDSLLTVNARLVDISTGTETPVPETTIGVYVKRLFGMQKLGEITTDENGEGSLEIPNGIPGDARGNLILVTRVDESEVFGNLEASSTQNWGVKVSDQLQGQPRALWSSNPPIWMLITFIVLMLAVWGHYLVIVYELFRLRKEEPATPAA